MSDAITAQILSRLLLIPWYSRLPKRSLGNWKQPMTIYHSLLARGYFPKELPPAFFTESFAKYAATRHGRATIKAYSPVDNFTECVKYRLALPGLDRREFRIPHPASFAKLAALTAQNFGRLLRASSSQFSRSRPVYSDARQRPLLPMVKPTDLPNERTATRAGSSYLLKTDVSQFYPSLYTHAIGWAVDPKLRQRAHWNNRKLLGKKLDQALMDMDGKVSQGVPIGNDISFLLAEVVLAAVDKAIKPTRSRSFRWFDDYELAFDTYEQAENALKTLNRELGKFRLRLNTKKTAIIQLPQPSQEEWQDVLKEAGAARYMNAGNMVRFFDTAFRLRKEFHDAPILMYALGILFKINHLRPEVARIAQGCITQALLCEPGAAQKAFALLTFWKLSGSALDKPLIIETVNQMIVRHQASGFSSDCAWALAFCLENSYALGAKAGRVLSAFDDDCIALQALQMHRRGLLPRGFKDSDISRVLKEADLDREHWLLAYETVRHDLLPVCAKAVKGNSLFADLLKNRVTFYRMGLPPYATVIHTGGAPAWVVKNWLAVLSGKRERMLTEEEERFASSAMSKLIESDLKRMAQQFDDPEEAISRLIELFGTGIDLTEFGPMSG